jgi:hypothetical protein
MEIALFILSIVDVIFQEKIGCDLALSSLQKELFSNYK